MPNFQQEITRHAKRQGKNPQSEETKQPSEQQTQMLELLGRESEIMLTNTLRALMHKADNIKEQIHTQTDREL